MNFTEYLTEGKEGKNVHLEHIQDQVLNRGVAGAREAINFLQSLRDMLAGQSNVKVNVTTKWDGAPAIFAGTNPENGKFFVGTKGVFNINPKLNYTDGDIDKNHPGEGLNAKLKVALRYLPKLGIKGILQGDMMFTKGDIDQQTIDGESYITFQPNTIVYAVPTDTKLAKTMLNAQLGVVFHTSYTGKKMADMKASFNVDIGGLTPTKDIWFRDASFVDTSGTATFTAEETKQLTTILSLAGRTFQNISPLTLNRIATNDAIKTYIKTFNNTKVREGKKVTNTTQHTLELIRYVETQLNKDIAKVKRDEAKRKYITIKTDIMRFFRQNSTELKTIFDLQNLLIDAKLMIVRKLETVKSIGTFVKTERGFRITAPEGFVAVSRTTGGAVKLVDQLEFSQANFNAAKSWDK
jgi:hypothetical protein